MKIVKENNISSFVKKLKKLSKEAPRTIAQMVAKKGEEIAKKQYASNSTGVQVGIVDADKNGNAQVWAEGKGLFYLEYGTGVKGEQSNYKGNLNFPISFTSSYIRDGRPVHITLKKWTYYYAYRHKPKLNRVKHEGHRAYAQMFNTAQELRKFYGIKRR